MHLFGLSSYLRCYFWDLFIPWLCRRTSMLQGFGSLCLWSTLFNKLWSRLHLNIYTILITYSPFSSDYWFSSVVVIWFLAFSHLLAAYARFLWEIDDGGYEDIALTNDIQVHSCSYYQIPIYLFFLLLSIIFKDFISDWRQNSGWTPKLKSRKTS